MKISNKDLNTFVETASKNLNKETGIFLHPTYIKYCIINSKSPEMRTVEQQKLLTLFPDVTVFTEKNLSVFLIDALKKGINPFLGDTQAVKQKEGEKEIKGSAQFLRDILATGNAVFDENVNTMSFTNADGETIYAHQLPNYDFVTISQFNDDTFIEQLRNDPDRYSEVLDTPEFKLLLERKGIRVDNMDGLRTVETKEGKEGEYTAGEYEKGITYAGMNKRERIATELGLYNVETQPNTKEQPDTKRGKTNLDYFYKTTVFINTIESKNSIHGVKMPIINAVTGNTLSDKAQDIMLGWVRQEMAGIGRTQKEITTDTYPDGKIFGYHTEGKKNAPERGLRLFQTRLMLGEDLATEVEALAKQGKPLTKELIAAIKKQIKEYWKGQVKDLAQLMIDEGLIRQNESGQYENILAPAFLFQGFSNDDTNFKTNIDTDFLHNLSQVSISNYINSMALNRMLYGDMSKSFIDPIDIVKRMAGANAQGPSMAFPFSAPNLGIEHSMDKIYHVTYADTKVKSSVEGDSIDTDDGQMYCTEKGLRYALFGFGKLNAVQADILNKLKAGQLITADEFFKEGGLKDNGPFNSLKVVYFDGATYLKCSMFPLFKTFTSYRNADGQWVAKPGQEKLHVLRQKLEDFENPVDENDKPLPGRVTVAHPTSVSKGLKKNLAASIDDISEEKGHFNTLEAKYMRQQLENPSNKMSITDPTQARQQIMAEQDDSLTVDFFGNPTTIGELKNMYMEDMSQRVTNNYQSAANSIFDLNGAMVELDKSIVGKQVTPKLAAFMERALETLQATGSDQQTLGFFELKDNKPVYNLNFPSTLEKFTQIFLSYFSKGVLSEKVPGHSLLRVPRRWI